MCYAALLISAVIPFTAFGAAPIKLTVHNPLPFTRLAEPVTAGVPLVRGVSMPLAIGGAPTQVQVTDTYADGSPRWVLIDFQADLPATGTAVYRLVEGGNVADPPVRLSYNLTGGVAAIDTGAATFRIDTRRFRLFDSVRVEGNELIEKAAESRGILIEKEDGTRVTAGMGPATAGFEDAGPLRAVLCVRGAIGPRTEKLPLVDYVCRMHFYAGKAAVRVFLTLHNPAAHTHRGNIWDLGSGGSAFLKDVSIVVPIAGSRSSRVSGCQGPATRLYQDSSGGVNWRSANHIDKDHKIPVSFQGYRVYRGDTKVAEGRRVDGWLHAKGDRGGVAVAVREFWQNFPKALGLEDGAVRIALWPREFAGTHELLGGEQKTHEMLFLFHEPSVTDAAVERKLQAFHRPLYAMPDPQAVLLSNAFRPSAPVDRNRYEKLEKTCDTAVYPRGGSADTIMTKWEQIDEYGWRHFGDTFADNERAPAAMVRDFPAHHMGAMPISHYVNEYEVIYAIMLQGLRRADPRWMWMADVCARHHADICIYHTDVGAPAYRHGPFMHTTHDTAAYRSTLRAYPVEARRYGLRYGQGGGPNAGHTYVTCLAQHYWLTGDRVSREAFLEVAEWAAESTWFRKGAMGDKRGYGNFLMTFVYAYQLTGDRKYYDRAMTLLGWIDEPFSGLGGTLFAQAAGRFLQMKIDNVQRDADYRTVLDLLMRFGDLYLALPSSAWNRYLEQRAFHAEVFCTCYLYAPKTHPNREAYYRKGRQILDEALERFPGRYVPTKTWVMCFANAGAYLKAERVHRLK